MRTLTIALAAAYLVTMMFSVGLELGGRPREDKAAKRRLRHRVVRALVLNLALLPLLAFGLAHALHADSHVGVALIILAATPGGRFAPQLTRLAEGDLGLSTEITLFLAKLVSFTAPVTARLMLHVGHLELRELGFILQLVVLQLVPYLVGKSVRKRRPQLAQQLSRPLDLAMLVLVVSVFALVLFAHDLKGVFHLAGERDWWAVLAFAGSSLMVGWLVGGRAAPTRRAFAVSAISRDLALALVLATLAFPDRSVHLATFAVWILFSAVGYGYAMTVRRRPIPARAVP